MRLSSKVKSYAKIWLQYCAYFALAFVLISAVVAGIMWIQTEGIFMKELAGTKARIESSPNFKNGVAQNLEPTPLYPPQKMKDTLKKAYNQAQTLTANKVQNPAQVSLFSAILSLLKPQKVQIPSVKSDLSALTKRDSFIWFGHSSYMISIFGQTILIDPVLRDNAAPLPFIIAPFNGADIYTPSELPAIDFLIITHNHYDHLSKKTIQALASKVSQAIVPLGVGKYLKAFGIDEGKITELDWEESIEFSASAGANTKADFSLDSVDFAFHCLSAKHFSGRGIFDRNKSLWASFVVEARAKSNTKSDSVKRVFIGGDGGYGAHFAKIGARFGSIDLAFLENGQYNAQWGLIHAFPYQTLQAGLDLRAKAIMTVHNAKFKLSLHDWSEPLEWIYALFTQGVKQGDFDFALLTPQIGQIVPLWRDSSSDFSAFANAWWEKK